MVTGSDFAIVIMTKSLVYSERYIYLWTELIPVLVFIGVGVLFWRLGRKTRAEVVTAPLRPWRGWINYTSVDGADT